MKAKSIRRTLEATAETLKRTKSRLEYARKLCTGTWVMGSGAVWTCGSLVWIETMNLEVAPTYCGCFSMDV